MDKKIAGLIGAVSALVALDAAQAATPAMQPLPQPTSYADLLQPIPNASAVLAKMDETSSSEPVGGQTIEVAYHHHHHHRHFRRHYHHHHHHHHHHY